MGPKSNRLITSIERKENALAAKTDLAPLTGLRFFAAFAVVIYHFARPAMRAWPAPIVQLAWSGYAAVSFFFLLSGFILSYSYMDWRGKLRGSRRDFYVARIARIYPAYALAFLLAAPHNLATTFHLSSVPVAAVKVLASATAALSLMQAWTPWTAWCWNFPAWSVSVEAFFYLVFPWFGRFLARLKISTCLMLCGALWLISMLAPTALFLTKGVTAAPELNDHLQMFIEFNPLLRLPEFLIGVLLGRAFLLGVADKLPTRGLSYLALGAILGILAFGSGIPHPLLANGLLAPLFACLILSLTKDRSLLSRFLALPFLVMLGEASYGVYILQIPVSYLLRMPPPLQSFASCGIYLVVLLGVALFSWHFVELPLRKYVRRRFMNAPVKNAVVDRRIKEWSSTVEMMSPAAGVK